MTILCEKVLIKENFGEKTVVDKYELMKVGFE